MNIERTNKTPEVKFDEETNTLMISGISIPENSQEFFNPILEWIEQHLSKKGLTLRINLEYYNTMSNHALLSVFRLFKGKDNGNIIWMYDEFDEEIGDAGRDFHEILSDSTNFSIEEIKD